jgi:hypothetical protein
LPSNLHSRFVSERETRQELSAGGLSDERRRTRTEVEVTTFTVSDPSPVKASASRSVPAQLLSPPYSRHSRIGLEVGKVGAMFIRKKTAIWAVTGLVFAIIFVVSVFAMARGARRTLYEQAPTSVRAGLNPIAHEAKPSAAIGVLDPALKTVAKSKQARRTAKKESGAR